jgi:hypothetical protein
MFDNLNSSVVDADENDILSTFGDDETPASGKKKTSEKKPVENSKDKKSSASSKGKPVLGTKTQESIPEFSDDDDDLFASDDEEEDQNKGKKKTETKKPVKEEEPEEDDDEPLEEDDDELEEEEPEEDDENKDKGNDEDADIKDFLKARVDLLIKKGEWADFEGSEDFEWNEDSFAEMELQQRNYQKQQMREELLDGFGPYGREIAEYAAKGGDPDKIIDIFKEQQRVESLSLETEEDQRAIVLKYETEFLNKKPERVKKYIDSLIADKELAAYAAEAKESMEEALTQQSQDLQAEQDAKVKASQVKQEQNMKKFQSDVSTLVNSMTDIPADEKKQLLNVLTKFDKKLKNGTPVNEFYFKFDNFRKDLPNYVKLVRFVLNPEKFIKSIENNGKSAATEKAFKLARGAASGKKLKTGQQDNTTGKAVKTKFQLL